MKQLSIQNQNFKLEDMFIVISLKTWHLLFNFSLLPFH